MPTLPAAIVALLLPFATLFTSPTWQKAQLLLVGTILTPGQRTAAWYDKPSPTFVDAIALVRRHLWLASEVFHCPQPTPIRRNSRSPCTTDL